MARKKKSVKGKLSGLKADGKPTAYWRRFKERLDSYNQTPTNEWKDEHFLGHILNRYKDWVGADFALSYSGPPSKCREMYCVRRMLLALGTENGETVKKYIDWVFDTVIIPKKVNISSIAFFFTTGFILSFKQYLRKNKTVTRATELPRTFEPILQKLNLTDLSTYGDLAFAKLVIDEDPNNDDNKIYIELFDQLKNCVGFDVGQLKAIEG